MYDVPFRNQLEVTDEQFLDHLTLPGRAGKELVAARKSGDAARAVGIVANHFRTRSKPVWSYYMHGSPWHETDAPGSVLEKAQRQLSGVFRNSWQPHQEMQLGVEPDWKSGLKQAGTSIGRNAFLTELSTAFALTGEAKYAAKARDLMHSFVAGVPFILEEKFFDDHDQYFGGAGNHTLTVTYRMFRWIDVMHSGAMHAPGAFSDADVFWVVKQLWFYSMQFYRLCGDTQMRRDNHHLVDHGHAPFIMGAMFPEFSIAREMAEQGAKVIRYHFGHNLQPDGAYSEHSAEYQYHVIYHFLHPLGVARANGIKLFSDADVRKLLGWVEFNVRCCKPDGMLPPIGDSSGRPLAYLFSTLAAAALTPRLRAMAAALGFAAGEPVRESAATVSSRMKKWSDGQPCGVGLSPYFTRKNTGKTTRVTETPTSHYPYGGYTFFRSEWSPRADYLSFSHFTKHLIGGHAHWDMLSFILHTKGKTLIGDPAACIYGDKRFYAQTGTAKKPGGDGYQFHRGYSYSVNAHNCLTMNNDTLKPLAAMSHPTFWGGSPPQCESGLFKAGGPIEIVEAWHDANHPTRHRRFVIHLRGIGFALVDLLSRPMLDLRPNQYAQYFHFEGDVEISSAEPKDGASLRAWLDDAECVIVPGSESAAKWQTWRDEYLDNLYGVANTKGLPWVAELTRTTRGPAAFSTFLLTGGASGLSDLPQAKYLGGKSSDWYGWQPEGISANALDLGEHGTVLLASCPYKKPLQSDELSTDAELAVVVLDRSGKLQSWAMARGSTLTVRGKKLVSGKKREWLAS